MYQSLEPLEQVRQKQHMPCGHISGVNGLDISMRLVQIAELHRRLERNAPKNLSNFEGVDYAPEGFMSSVQSSVSSQRDSWPDSNAIPNHIFVGQVLGTEMEE